MCSRLSFCGLHSCFFGQAHVGRYAHFLYHVLQTALNVGQCESGVWNKIVVACFLDFLRKGRPHHEAQCLLELGFGPLFLLGRGLSLTCARLAADASVLGQLVGWPNSFALAALRGEFFRVRENSHSPTPSIRQIACPFPEGERDAQQVLGLEESASQMSCFLILTEIQKIPHSLWGWSVQSAQKFQIATCPVVRCRRSVKPHPVVNPVEVIEWRVLDSV